MAEAPLQPFLLQIDSMRFSLFIFLFVSFSLSAQDAYHLSLLERLETNHGLVGGSFIIADNEADLASQSYTYGDIMDVTDLVVTDMEFTRSKQFVLNVAGANSWDAGFGQPSKQSVSNDDLVLVTFWAKRNSNDAQVFVFAEDAISYDKEVFFPLDLTPDWTQYFFVFNATKGFNVGRLSFGFQLASMAQDIEIAGFTAINYEDKYGISDVPSSFSPFNYEGREADAPWRSLAEDRIETLRKADLVVQVEDGNGNRINDATVNIEMQQHEFGFGSALVTCRFPGNNCYDETYVEKILDLDGEGHGFNECVNENALKWRSWEQEWLGTKEEMVGAFQWLDDNDVTMRGHNLLWPGRDFLPNDINSNLDDLAYVRNRLHDRLEEMLNHPELSKIVRDWDVINEITTNRTLEYAFDNDPNFESGRELYGEVFRKARELDPELELYINDYMVITSGSASQIALYKSFLDEMLEDDVPFDGIGFQCHIGSIPNSIPMVEQQFDEFYERYGKRMKVTEYDINDAVDEETQAAYMRDLLTLTFSHPGMDAFIMWGFWDNNHWKDNAPMFNSDWSLKPSGEAFISKVFNEWWTEESAQTNSLGEVEFRPFKGKHLVTVTKDGVTTESELLLNAMDTVTIVMNELNAVEELDGADFSLAPNPSSNGIMTVDFPKKFGQIDLDIYNIEGQKVQTFYKVNAASKLNLNIPAGNYQVEFKTNLGSTIKKLVVL